MTKNAASVNVDARPKNAAAPGFRPRPPSPLEQTSVPGKRFQESGDMSPGSPAGGYTAEPVSTRPCHGKTLLGGKDPEFVRPDVPLDDSGYRPATSGTTQPLWDSSSDPLNTAKCGWSDKHSHVDHLPPFHPSKDFQAPQLAEKDLGHPSQGFGYGKPLIKQTVRCHGGQAKQPFLPETGHEYRSSSSEDDSPNDPDSELEMLLQPETRPISHEQLVVEVKGIYAGLVMVEAKCIDTDERQSAAAQEKDPSKKTNLKNDQWQSLIALHKQVRL